MFLLCIPRGRWQPGSKAGRVISKKRKEKKQRNNHRWEKHIYVTYKFIHLTKKMLLRHENINQTYSSVKREESKQSFGCIWPLPVALLAWRKCLSLRNSLWHFCFRLFCFQYLLWICEFLPTSWFLSLYYESIYLISSSSIFLWESR